MIGKSLEEKTFQALIASTAPQAAALTEHPEMRSIRCHNFGLFQRAFGIDLLPSTVISTGLTSAVPSQVQSLSLLRSAVKSGSGTSGKCGVLSQSLFSGTPNRPGSQECSRISIADLPRDGACHYTLRLSGIISAVAVPAMPSAAHSSNNRRTSTGDMERKCRSIPVAALLVWAPDQAPLGVRSRGTLVSVRSGECYQPG